VPPRSSRLLPGTRRKGIAAYRAKLDEPLAVLPILPEQVYDELTAAGAKHYGNRRALPKKCHGLTAGSDQAAEVDYLIAELGKTPPPLTKAPTTVQPRRAHLDRLLAAVTL